MIILRTCSSPLSYRELTTRREVMTEALENVWVLLHDLSLPRANQEAHEATRLEVSSGRVQLYCIAPSLSLVVLIASLCLTQALRDSGPPVAHLCSLSSLSSTYARTHA